MRPTLRLVCICAVAAAIIVARTGHAEKAEPASVAPTGDKPLIQVALLLDTSNSMDGLIDQAKTQLWNIVNEFATAKRGGKTPELQVALYEYGNDNIPAGEGYIRLVIPLTTDLDGVSEKLFALRTRGGQEYCGQVIKAATESLAWSPSSSVVRAVFIAGNEPFTQGNVDFHGSCKEAIQKGIVVNTIFCGNFDEGSHSGWKDGAVLADGSYMSIDQNRKTVAIDAPQDKDLARLSAELNHTYVPYGRLGMANQQRQLAQDANALRFGAAAAPSRAAAKASAQYTNSNWDLVDAIKNGNLKYEALKDEDLPAEMQKMKPAERKAYVEKQTAERGRIQKEIIRLSTERQRYVSDELKKRGQAGDNALEAAIIESVRKQATKQGFAFEKSKGK